MIRELNHEGPGTVAPFVRITSSDGETRWINLDRITRATLAVDAHGEPLLVLLFGEHDASERLQLRGQDETDRHAIEAITCELDRRSVSCSIA